MSLDQIAFLFSDPGVLAAIGVGFVFLIAAWTVVAPMMLRDRLVSRLKAVTSQREELRRASREALAKADNRSIRRKDTGMMGDLVKNLNLKSLLEDPNVERKLLQAGFRGPGPLSTFYFFRFALPFAGAVLALIFAFSPANKELQDVQKLGIVIVGVAIGFYLPNFYIANIAQKRMQSIMVAFSDALDMMLICVESGMSVELAVARVAGEIGTASVALAEELTLTNAELSYLPERRMAWENLTQRVNHPGVRSVALAMLQSERYGTPVSSALRTLAKENRELRMTNAEKKAASLPAKLTVPMIVFFLPVLFLVILGPAYITYKQSEDDRNNVNGSAASTGSSEVAKSVAGNGNRRPTTNRSVARNNSSNGASRAGSTTGSNNRSRNSASPPPRPSGPINDVE
jgi:tight adherence protein C